MKQGFQNCYRGSEYPCMDLMKIHEINPQAKIELDKLIKPNKMQQQNMCVALIQLVLVLLPKSPEKNLVNLKKSDGHSLDNPLALPDTGAWRPPVSGELVAFENEYTST